MAQASRRLRRERRVKRERSLLRRAIGVQQNQLQTVVKLLMDAQAEVWELKPTPAITITTLADDVAPDTAEDITALYPAGPITEEMNDACCIDDSATS
jgi:hypothetical protein